MLFISPYKLFSFSGYLIFCLDFVVMCKNGLTRKIRLLSEFVKSQPFYKELQYTYWSISHDVRQSDNENGSVNRI